MRSQSFALKFVSLFVLQFFILACAKPNYQDAPPANPFQTQPDEPQKDPEKPKPPPTQIFDPLPTNPPEPPSCDLLLSSEQLCIQYRWTKSPTTEQMGEFEMTFTGSASPYEKTDPQLKPFVKLWMAEHGHGSRPVAVEKIETGKYRISKIFFSMPGKWQIRFQLLNEKNEVADQVIDEINF
jgi:hypothetical protein